jgi:hypothetical protein
VIIDGGVVALDDATGALGAFDAQLSPELERGGAAGRCRDRSPGARDVELLAAVVCAGCWAGQRVRIGGLRCWGGAEGPDHELSLFQSFVFHTKDGLEV